MIPHRRGRPAADRSGLVRLCALWRRAVSARRRLVPVSAPWLAAPGEAEDAACRRWVESVGRAVLLGVALEQERQAGGAQ